MCRDSIAGSRIIAFLRRELRPYLGSRAKGASLSSVVTAVLLLVSAPARAETEDVSWRLERIRLDHHLPALAAATMVDGVIVSTGIF